MQVEGCMIRATDTIVNPRTVMVISVNALIADVAMSTLWQTNNLAERTETLCIECLQQAHKVNLGVMFDVG